MGFINKNLVIAHLSAKDSTQAISQIADLLYKSGKVKSTYKQAVLDREKTFPTGLPSGEICVAVPHTDVKYVNEPAIAFATLNNPVTFANMADKSQKIKVSVIAMLAMKEPHSQVKLLQNLMELFQKQDYLKELISIDDPEKLFEKLNSYFDEEV